MMDFVKDAIINLGTAACPPYHLAIVIGGTSAEYTMKTVKMASIKALDNLATEGSESGHGWRDLEWEERILDLTRELDIGAQFGGKYFCHDVRVVAYHAMEPLALLGLVCLVLPTDKLNLKSQKKVSS